MAEYALRLQNGTDTAVRMRMGDALPLFPVAALQARSGLRPDGGGNVTVVSGSMSVQVTAFAAWLDGGTSDAQGGYPFFLDATKTLTIADGDATQARTDTIVAQVQDTTYDSSGNTVAVLTVVKGTPGAGAPNLPATCVPLRDVSVPAGTSAGTGGLTSSNLGADRRTYTVGLGGILPVAGVTERDALLKVGGTAVFRKDTGNVQVWNGTAWDTYYANQKPRQTGATTTGLTPDASGRVFINHSLGVVPSYASAECTNSNYTMSLAFGATTTTQLCFVVRRISDGAVGAVAVDAVWLAFP